MIDNNFDEKFQDLFTNMVEIAFEYVERNQKEIETIYIFGSMENNTLFYNVFYKINGHMVKIHKINTVSKQQYDISDDRVFKLLKLGKEYLKATITLFKQANRQVPTLMKMVYSPPSGKFNNDISYDLHYSNDDKKMVSDVFNEWFIYMGGKLS